MTGRLLRYRWFVEVVVGGGGFDVVDRQLRHRNHDVQQLGRADRRRELRRRRNARRLERVLGATDDDGGRLRGGPRCSAIERPRPDPRQHRRGKRAADAGPAERLLRLERLVSAVVAHLMQFVAAGSSGGLVRAVRVQASAPAAAGRRRPGRRRRRVHGRGGDRFSGTAAARVRDVVVGRNAVETVVGGRATRRGVGRRRHDCRGDGRRSACHNGRDAVALSPAVGRARLGSVRPRFDHVLRQRRRRRSSRTDGLQGPGSRPAGRRRRLAVRRLPD